MHERLRIHHGVGSRVLFDSDHPPAKFSYEQQPGGGWSLAVQTEKTPAVEEVLRLKNEVNVFIFREADGSPVEKDWFYTGDAVIEYREDEKCLRIHASSHIAYKPGDFER